MSRSPAVFSAIPAHYLDELLRIERLSNPHAWSEESLSDSYQQFSHLGAFVGTTLVAFAVYRHAVDEAEIIHVVCDKACQGRGYVYGLLYELQRQLRDKQIKRIFLEVREDNTRARHVYRQLGFTTVGKRRNYYGDNSGVRCDALIKQLVL